MSRGTTKGHWLFKEEPTHFSFDELVKDGRASWNGVHNNSALKHLRSVRREDEILFYHTGEERRIVGIMKATSDAYPDPEAGKDTKLVAVDVKPVRKLPRPVTLSEMKSDPDFEGFDLLRISRLSVMPVPGRAWKKILKLSEG